MGVLLFVLERFVLLVLLLIGDEGNDDSGLADGLEYLARNGVGERAREVPVLRRWERVLINRVKNGDPESFAFREQRKTENQNLITDFVARSDAPFVIQARRMRSTWLVHHINNGAPVVAFLEAAGIQSLEALDRFLFYAATYDSVQMISVLR